MIDKTLVSILAQMHDVFIVAALWFLTQA